MTMPVRPTLGELTLSLLRRCGLASGGSVPANIAPILTERLSQAQTILHSNLDMTHLWFRQEVPLVPGTTVYDWPDDIEVGDLRTVIAVHIDGSEVPLAPGMTSLERNSAFRTVGSDGSPVIDRPEAWGAPVCFTIENGAITIGPAPDDQWTALRYEGFLSPQPFNDTTVRCAVDSEALLMKAEILVRQHFGMDTKGAEQAFAGYIDDLRTKQGDGEGFQVGGRQSIRLRPQARNKVFEAERGRVFPRYTSFGI